MVLNPTIQGQNMIFAAMREHFGMDWYKRISKDEWSMWRGHITKQLFDQDIIAPEAIAVIPGIDKRQWPAGTGFFSRVRDMVLLGRKQKEQIIKIEKSPESLGNLLKSYTVDKPLAKN